MRMLVCYVLTFVNKCGGVVKVVLCCKKLVEMTKNQKNLLCRGVEKPASTQENDAFWRSFDLEMGSRTPFFQHRTPSWLYG